MVIFVKNWSGLFAGGLKIMKLYKLLNYTYNDRKSDLYQGQNLEVKFSSIYSTLILKVSHPQAPHVERANGS